MLPVKGEPRRIGRRLLTFLVTVPLAMLTSLLAALAARSLAGLGGWAEADGNGLTLLLLPLLWGILAFALLMMPRRRTQFAWLPIGRASCRARVCPSVYISVVARSVKKKNTE